MSMYEYRCGGCGHRILSDERGDQVLTRCCGAVGQRIWSVSTATIMHEHMNSSVGKPISDMRQFKDELARKSDAATERTGIPHNFQPVDINDHKGLGVANSEVRP
jgi:hypothetical protein